MKTTNSWSLWLILLTCVLLFGCNKNPSTSGSGAQSSAKHYQLKGKVVSIDKQGKMLNVENEAIPGYMDAMTMPYQVKPESELDTLHPGDAITADLIVQDDSAWLENIAVTKSGAAAAPK
jgi:protein SCO1